MILTVGAVNLVLGLAYVTIGVMTWMDMRRNRHLGFSHFGLAIVVLAFTCGPHHLHHGVHVLFEERPGGSLDLVTTLVGILPAAIWVALRLEAWLGGRGERSLVGMPAWMEAMPTLGAVYVVSLVAVVLSDGSPLAVFEPIVIPNLALVLVYMAIGVVLMRTQISNRWASDTWSLSGLSLAGLFLTCALMHAVHALYVGTGLYDADWHGRVLDALSVPAGLYFLWVVNALSLGRIRDWDPGAVPAQVDEQSAEFPLEVGG